MRRIDGDCRESIFNDLGRVGGGYGGVILAQQLWQRLFRAPWQSKKPLKVIREETVEEDDACENLKSVNYFASDTRQPTIVYISSSTQILAD